MYTRFLIPELKQNLDKVLYSDVDVIFLGDIGKMYEENLDGFIIGAVPETFLCDAMKKIYNNRLLLSPQHQPFASGNLIIDCTKWRAEHITEKIFLIDIKKTNNIKYDDQTLMNICFNNNYKQLKQKYCYTIQHDVCFPSKDIIICHYNGPVKPWQIDEKTQTDLMPHLKEFWYYAKMTPFYDDLKAQIKKPQNDLIIKLKVFRTMAKRNFC